MLLNIPKIALEIDSYVNKQRTAMVDPEGSGLPLTGAAAAPFSGNVIVNSLVNCMDAEFLVSLVVLEMTLTLTKGDAEVLHKTTTDLLSATLNP